MKKENLDKDISLLLSESETHFSQLLVHCIASSTDCSGLVGEYFIKKKFPNIMGLSYVHESPYIMGLSYVLSIMGLSYVQRFLILWGFLMYSVPFSIMGLSYVQLVCKIIGFSPNPSQYT